MTRGDALRMAVRAISEGSAALTARAAAGLASDAQVEELLLRADAVEVLLALAAEVEVPKDGDL